MQESTNRMDHVTFFSFSYWSILQRRVKFYIGNVTAIGSCSWQRLFARTIGHGAGNPSEVFRCLPISHLSPSRPRQCSFPELRNILEITNRMSFLYHNIGDQLSWEQIFMVASCQGTNCRIALMFL